MPGSVSAASQVLELHWAKWYVVTGACCLAWCTGFLAILNPGGLDVREAVFVAAMQFAWPPNVLASFHANKAALIGFLSILFIHVKFRLSHP